MGRSLFENALFQLADVWCEGASAGEYAAFLDDLAAVVCERDLANDSANDSAEDLAASDSRRWPPLRLRPFSVLARAVCPLGPRPPLALPPDFLPSAAAAAEAEAAEAAASAPPGGRADSPGGGDRGAGLRFDRVGGGRWAVPSGWWWEEEEEADASRPSPVGISSGGGGPRRRSPKGGGVDCADSPDDEDAAAAAAAAAAARQPGPVVATDSFVLRLEGLTSREGAAERMRQRGKARQSEAEDGWQARGQRAATDRGSSSRGDAGGSAAAPEGAGGRDRKSTRLNSSHITLSRMPSSA